MFFFFLDFRHTDAETDWLATIYQSLSQGKIVYSLTDWRMVIGDCLIVIGKINCKDVYRATLNPPCSCFSH